MGVIIIFVCISILFIFMSGLIFSEIRDSCDDKDEVLCGLFILGFISSIFLSVVAIQGYYEKKEYPAAKYELKKKVITIEENNTVKIDTVYTFKHK